MKIVFHLTSKRFDIADFAKKYPEHPMVVTRDLAALAREIRDAEVMVTSNRPYAGDMVKAVNDNQTALKWIQFTTSGIDKALRYGGFPEGVRVTNSAGLSAPILAEHAFFLFLAVARRIREIEAAVARREWIRDEITPRMIALTWKTLCVVGMGATGQEAARRAKAFGMKVLGVSRAYRPDALVDEVFPRERAEEALARADFVLLSVPATADTVKFVNEKRLAVMKPTAIVANVARGDLIDEDALVAACRAGRIGGAGLDVTRVEPTPADSPLWSEPRIVLTPHVAGTGADTSERLFEIIADNLDRYLAGKPLTRQLDWESMKPGSAA